MYLFRVTFSNNVDEYYASEPDDISIVLTVEAPNFDEAMAEAKSIVGQFVKNTYNDFEVVKLTKLERKPEIQRCTIENPCEDCLRIETEIASESAKKTTHSQDELWRILDGPEEPVKKASEIWCLDTGIEIMDPDGWNRRDYDNSWGELITREEFIKRAYISTCRAWPNPLLDGGPSYY